MKRVGNCLATLIPSLLALVVAGCVTPIPGANRDLLQFLRTGQTARQEVLP